MHTLGNWAWHGLFFAGRQLRGALAGLPLILVLASLALVLEASHKFHIFDDAMLTLVSKLKPPAPTEVLHDKLVTVMVTRQMFETELNRKLPIDKVALRTVIEALGEQEPKVVAIDVDAIPDGPPPPEGSSQAPPMQEAILTLLQRGIHVVAVSYPRLTEKHASQARDWRRLYCKAAVDIKDTGKGKGKLYWASAWLQSEGGGDSVLRYSPPGKAEKVAEENESLLPLGLVLWAATETAMESGTRAGANATVPPNQPAGRAEALRRQASAYCETVLASNTGHAKPSKPASGARAPDEPDALINYFGRTPLELELSSIRELKLRKLDLQGKAVMLGVSSFEKVDTHLTPLGQLPGAVVHSLVAASVGVPLAEDHLMAFGLDVLMGYVFMVMLLGLREGSKAVEARAPKAHTLLRLINVATPLIPLLITALFVLVCMPRLTSSGLWLNPLPVLMGLLIHLYAELTEREAGHEVSLGKEEPDVAWRSSPRQFFKLFLAQLAASLIAPLVAWWKNWRSLALLTRSWHTVHGVMWFDLGAWLAMRVISLALIVWGLSILTHWPP